MSIRGVGRLSMGAKDPGGSQKPAKIVYPAVGKGLAH